MYLTRKITSSNIRILKVSIIIIPFLNIRFYVEWSDSSNPLVDDNFSPVWGVTDVESQLAVVVLHDGGSSVGERPLLEQGHGTAPETAPSHTGPEMGL